MSSPRSAEAGNGLVCQATGQQGPLRMPETAAEDFVREFNRTYAAIGLSVQPAPASVGASADQPEEPSQ